MEAIEKLKPYTKTVVAFIVGVLQVMSLMIMLNADGKLSPEDYNAIITAIIISLGGTAAVYQFPNKDKGVL